MKESDDIWNCTLCEVGVVGGQFIFPNRNIKILRYCRVPKGIQIDIEIFG